MATTKRGRIIFDMEGMDQGEVEKMGDSMVEALTRFEEDQDDLTLKEALTLIIEPSEFFIAEGKEGTIAKSPRFRKAVEVVKKYASSL
jgi:hypothetical protein